MLEGAGGVVSIWGMMRNWCLFYSCKSVNCNVVNWFIVGKRCNYDEQGVQCFLMNLGEE
jgi:hypothetical protein